MGRDRPYLRLIAEAAERAVPLDVMIELTHRCNFRCRHCYIPDFTAPDGLATARVLALLDELADMGTLRLALSGGEMMLRRDWLDVARHGRALGFDLRLLTNASLVTAPVADEIAALYATVEVSLYSLDATVFESVTGVPGSLARVLAAIDLLLRRGVDLLVKVPVMTLNAASAAGVARWAADNRIDCRTDPLISHRKDGSLAPIALRLPPGRLPARPAAQLEEVVATPAGAGRDGPLCAAGTRYANITASGDVLACNLLPVVAGNVLEAPFRETWERSPWLARLRSLRRGDLAACAACGKLSFCGRCPAQALIEDGDLLAPSAWACESARALDAIRERPALPAAPSSST